MHRLLWTAALVWIGGSAVHAQQTDPAGESQPARAPATAAATLPADFGTFDPSPPRRGLDVSAPTQTEPDPPRTVQPLSSVLGLPEVSLRVDPSILGPAPGQPLPGLRREGEFLIRAFGRLYRPERTDQRVFIFGEQPDGTGLRPMILQPSRTLESMEDVTARLGDGTLIRLSGQIHTYRGQNYLLPTEFEEARAEALAGDNPVPKPLAGEGADSILDELTAMGQRPEVETTNEPELVAVPTAMNPAETRENRPRAVGRDALGRALPTRRDGEFLVKRAGRMQRSRDGRDALFVFLADDPDSPEPPMVLLPCQLTQRMEQTVTQLGEEVVMLVSGRVHLYRGKNYLLPTILQIQVQRGNLTPVNP